MEKRAAAALVITLVLAGCASSTQPSVMVYPAKGQSMELQTRDSGECQTWAKQQTGFDPATEAGKGAAIGAVVGAIGGAAAGAAIGAATGGGAGKGAAVGATVGGLGGAAGGGTYQYSKSKEGYDRAYAACMQGRGYAVK